jgi:hypothetical protein
MSEKNIGRPIQLAIAVFALGVIAVFSSAMALFSMFEHVEPYSLAALIAVVVSAIASALAYLYARH